MFVAISRDSSRVFDFIKARSLRAHLSQVTIFEICENQPPGHVARASCGNHEFARVFPVQIERSRMLAFHPFDVAVAHVGIFG